MPWLSLLLNKATVAAFGVGALVLFLGIQGVRLEQAKEATAVATQRAELAESTAKQTREALDIYKAEVADNAQRAAAAGKVRATTQKAVVSIMSSKLGEAEALALAKAHAAAISEQWSREADDEQ